MTAAFDPATVAAICEPSRRRRSARARFAQVIVGVVFGLAVLAQTCCTVTVYQPMRTLARPVAIDLSRTNFDKTRILIRCFATEEFPTDSASSVCRQLSTMLSQQGADTAIMVPRREEENPDYAFEDGPTDFTIDVKSRNEHEEGRDWLAPIWCLSLTAIPWVEEQTYSMRVMVRGRDGSVLADELMRARFVEYTGILVWSINLLLDWTVREDDEELMDDAAKKDFSRDFYHQVSQLTYNARVRSELLGLTKRPTRAETTAPVERAPQPAAAPPPAQQPAPPAAAAAPAAVEPPAANAPPPPPSGPPSGPTGAAATTDPAETP